MKLFWMIKKYNKRRNHSNIINLLDWLIRIYWIKLMIIWNVIICSQIYPRTRSISWWIWYGVKWKIKAYKEAYMGIVIKGKLIWKINNYSTITSSFLISHSNSQKIYLIVNHFPGAENIIEIHYNIYNYIYNW